jgi:hypothetical protein
VSDEDLRIITGGNNLFLKSYSCRPSFMFRVYHFLEDEQIYEAIDNMEKQFANALASGNI